MLFKSLDQILPIIDPPIVVGLSGGVDSIVLLHAMLEQGYAPIAAHFDHLLREESSQEAAFLEEYCLEIGLPFRVGEGNVSHYAEEHSLSIEEAGRNLRYEFLFGVARQEMAGAVAVAHHADDQIETILMNLLRGAGTKGLGGMQVVSLPNPWSSSIPIVRPFLEVHKEQLLSYHSQNQLPVLEDPSNQDQTYFRNQIRHTLIPQLEALKPGVSQRLLQTTQILGADDQALEFFADQSWEICLGSQGGSYIQINRDKLLEFPIAIQRRLIRKALHTLRPDFRDLSFLHVEAALEFIRDHSRKSSNWVAKVNLSQSPRKLVLSTWETDMVKDQFPQLMDQRDLSIEEEYNLDLGNGWMLEIQGIPYSMEQYPGLDIPGEDFMVWMDRDAVLPGGKLRVREEGDVIKPMGMTGKSIKVSDLMINEKIPAPYRDDWPIISGREGILWVPGCRLAQEGMIVPETESVLSFRFIHRKD